jgi:mannose-6-phosphate isomerase-like protein (cupin superfamily)
MAYEAINFAGKFGLFREQWQPKVIAEMNDYQFKLVRLEGDFIWHDHKDTDETFIVLDGVLRIDFRDGAVLVWAGEMFVVPKGVEHRPSAEHEVRLLLIEPRGVRNTGDEGGAARPRTMSGSDGGEAAGTAARPRECARRRAACRPSGDRRQLVFAGSRAAQPTSQGPSCRL